ncbi:MAG: DUF72 domain-containing protein [bacterium]|nr:MAG: DUF72 domain-containing protein [bacterium]
MVDHIQETVRTLYIGPAGWSYQDWVGPVYPPGKRIDQLLLIARYFNCIELNSSFYRVPGRKLVESWLKRISTVPGFIFTVKVWQRFTHERSADEGEVRDFIQSFSPLIEDGRIGSFLLQFPWSFKNTKESRRYLQRLGMWFAGQPVAVELRHGSWNDTETVEFLAGCRLAFCNIDQPQVGYSLPPTEHVTSEEIGYIRLHGRNKKNWFRADADRDARYDYLYNAGELEEWRKRARSILARVKNLFIIMNNHYRGQALANAAQLRSMIDARKIDLPPRLVLAFNGLRDIASNAPAQGDLLENE